MARHVVSVTSDIVVIDERLNVLVIKRKNPPFQDQWALPGGYVDEGETFLDAAVRELKEETGIDARAWELKPMAIRDAPDRDPRGRVISQPFRWYAHKRPEVTAGDDATDFMWWPGLKNGLAFDHDEVVREALNGYL